MHGEKIAVGIASRTVHVKRVKVCKLNNFRLNENIVTQVTWWKKNFIAAKESWVLVDKRCFPSHF